jgi:aspartate-semialdehyde dehydrogenase
MQGLKVGIMGATGMVGREILKVLGERKFPIKELSVFASKRSEGKEIQTPLGKKIIQNSEKADYSQFDLVFFAIGGLGNKKNIF